MSFGQDPGSLALRSAELRFGWVARVAVVGVLVVLVGLNGGSTAAAGKGCSGEKNSSDYFIPGFFASIGPSILGQNGPFGNTPFMAGGFIGAIGPNQNELLMKNIYDAFCLATRGNYTITFVGIEAFTAPPLGGSDRRLEAALEWGFSAEKDIDRYGWIGRPDYFVRGSYSFVCPGDCGCGGTFSIAAPVAKEHIDDMVISEGEKPNQRLAYSGGMPLNLVAQGEHSCPGGSSAFAFGAAFPSRAVNLKWTKTSQPGFLFQCPTGKKSTPPWIKTFHYSHTGSTPGEPLGLGPVAVTLNTTLIVDAPDICGSP